MEDRRTVFLKTEDCFYRQNNRRTNAGCRAVILFSVFPGFRYSVIPVYRHPVILPLPFGEGRGGAFPPLGEARRGSCPSPRGG